MQTDPNEVIHLLCAADRRYGAYAGIMFSSMLHNNPGAAFHLHLLSDGIRNADLRRIGRLARRAGSALSVYDVRRKLTGFSGPAGYHLNRTAYARLLVGGVLPTAVRHVIYLDCDVICTGPIGALWRLAPEIPILGAVRDRAGAGWKARLGLPPEASYFNTGVLVINVAGWAQLGIGERLAAWVVQNADRVALADQDAINACLQERITPLPECWNLQIGSDSGSLPESRLGGAVLLHYTSTPKPWRFRFAGLGAEIFRNAKRRSPWRFKPPAFQFSYRLRKSVDKRLRARRLAPFRR